MSDFLFATSVVAPTFIIIFIGRILRTAGVINDDFVRRSSIIVFRIALPSLIIAKLSQTRPSEMLPGLPVVIFIAWTLLFFIVGWLVVKIFIARPISRGAFVQGCFRSNIAILGFPIIRDFLGDDKLVLAVVYLAFAMPMYNILAVIVLSATSEDGDKFHPGAVLFKIFTNPLIVAVFIGGFLGYCSFHLSDHDFLHWLQLPDFALKTIDSFSNLTFPLALLGIGASLRPHVFGPRGIPAVCAAAVKTVLLPVCICLTGYALGLRSDALAVMFVIAGAPTAVSSFIMAKAMHSDGELAAEIVFVSTLMSLGTLTLGIYILRLMGFA